MNENGQLNLLKIKHSVTTISLLHHDVNILFIVLCKLFGNQYFLYKNLGVQPSWQMKGVASSHKSELKLGIPFFFK